MTAKQPQAGEWWECRGTRVRIVGRMFSGDVVCELCDRSISVMGPIDLIGEIWQHLPDCDSWTWESEVFPQYWTAINDCMFAYCLRLSADRYCMIKRDGSRGFELKWYQDTTEGRKQLTKEAAEALVDKPSLPSPVEHPSNEQLLEMIANLRDQMAAIAKRIEPLPPSQNRVPVRLWVSSDDWSIMVCQVNETPSRVFGEMKSGPDGFYCEVQS